LSLCSNPGLKLVNAFGVFVPNFKLTHCSKRQTLIVKLLIELKD